MKSQWGRGRKRWTELVSSHSCGSYPGHHLVVPIVAMPVSPAVSTARPTSLSFINGEQEFPLCWVNRCPSTWRLRTGGPPSARCGPPPVPRRELSQERAWQLLGCTWHECRVPSQSPKLPLHACSVGSGVQRPSGLTGHCFQLPDQRLEGRWAGWAQGMLVSDSAFQMVSAFCVL